MLTGALILYLLNIILGLAERSPEMNGIYPCAQITYVKQTCKPITLCVHVHAESSLTICDPADCSPPGFSVRGILQARLLEWVAISSSRGSSQPRGWTHISWVSCIGRQVRYELRHWGSPSSPTVTDRSARRGQLWGDQGSCSQCPWMKKWSGASLDLTSLQGLLNESRFSPGRRGHRFSPGRRGHRALGVKERDLCQAASVQHIWGR